LLRVERNKQKTEPKQPQQPPLQTNRAFHSLPFD
jgi:hypothetical protein